MTNPSDSLVRRPKGRPRLVESADRLNEILGAALELFAELGFAGVTMDAVAKRARTSKETLYALFPGKPALFQGVLEAQISKWAAGEFQGRPPITATSLREALFEFIDMMIRASISPEFQVMARLIQEEAFRFPELAAVLRENGSERALDLCTNLIETFAEVDKVPCRDARSVADAIVSLAEGWGRNNALHQRVVSEADRQQWINRILDIILGGRAAW